MRPYKVLTLAILCVAAAVPTARGYYSGAPQDHNPIAGHPWYVDHAFGVWWETIRQDGSAAAPLRAFAENPMTKTFGAFEPHPEIGLREYLDRAASEEPGAIPFISLSRIEHQSCPYVSPGADYSSSAVKDWVRRFSDAIGNDRVMVLVEPDKLAVMGCVPGSVQRKRYDEIVDEIHTLHSRNHNAIVYLDAGASDWVSAGAMTRELRRAGIADAQGFALGASHFAWTSSEITYGLKISRALGGKHFVINTDSNGWGPRPRGHSRFYHPGCTPTGAGIGFRPTVLTPDSHIDAYLWLGTPGFDPGACLGLGSAYSFHLSLALSLVRNANPPAGRGPGKS